jgi:hypothetical protein
MSKNRKISYNELLHNAGMINDKMKKEFKLNGLSIEYKILKNKREGVVNYASRLWKIDSEEVYNDLYNKNCCLRDITKKNNICLV